VSAAAPKARVFLDTSALFAGIWSGEGGARLLLKLGEAEVLHIVLSSQVLAEIDDVLRRKAPETLGQLALLLHESRIEVTPPPSPGTVARCMDLTGYAPDAEVLAGAWDAGVDFFATLDKVHFLDNAEVKDNAPFHVGTPGDCVAWIRAHLDPNEGT
jgi:predicted nucleic acid-binding protein